MEKLNDLGTEYSYGDVCCETKKDSSSKKKKRYPRESFTVEQMPGLKGATVGQKVKMTIIAEVVEVSQGEEYMMSGEDEDKAKKTIRVAIKMLEGGAELQGKMSNSEEKTYSEKKNEEADNFNKMIDLEDEEE